MDDIVSQFATAPTAILGVACFIGTFFIRRLVETAQPSIKKKSEENEAGPTYETEFARWWNQFILYLIPVALGSGIAAMNIPYLCIEGMSTSSGLAMYGGIVGWFSSFIYKMVRQAIKKRTGVDINPTPSVIPGNGSDE